MDIQPLRGQIWLIDLNPIRGHEQAGTRPALVVSNDTFNQGPAGLVFILPLTRTDRRIPAHIPVDPPEGGVKTRSYVLCDAIRSISKDRFVGSAWGTVSAETMQQVEEMLRILIDL
ncbi:type II toxin-antitoxin system PemK/MazF family toxin [Caldilinea sp.]|uniref:type II toxin-antitoxin system PemK/MazF family toxin n=1 Tax=Caldilinea sp. TaxID=2293560 RepID=UPI002C3D0388|nr:type II toxin-antitoxin system PemK/MazF family toxin [Anaerolineales bacterium]HQY92218.1 type II toxin-antitoxin system PemK/MazF family toxin [Caldilinea sp.]